MACPAASGSPRSNGAGYLCGAGGCSRVPTAAVNRGSCWRPLRVSTAASASTRAVLSQAATGEQNAAGPDTLVELGSAAGM